MYAKSPGQMFAQGFPVRREILESSPFSFLEVAGAPTPCQGTAAAPHSARPSAQCNQADTSRLDDIRVNKAEHDQNQLHNSRQRRGPMEEARKGGGLKTCNLKKQQPGSGRAEGNGVPSSGNGGTDSPQSYNREAAAEETLDRREGALFTPLRAWPQAQRWLAGAISLPCPPACGDPTTLPPTLPPRPCSPCLPRSSTMGPLLQRTVTQTLLPPLPCTPSFGSSAPPARLASLPAAAGPLSQSAGTTPCQQCIAHPHAQAHLPLQYSLGWSPFKVGP
ncbi:uncharacterized protein LOC116649462 isoform X2 [Phoca vitulina]|uniref:uncharacterized protein LOC116649462 isoform X2 n=1 Tax=Phoca vitulina TaxID=9720 RepID=UPI00139621A3|nr:uncharacterized protein LOC116649462 isoform X2 [Phoca vitulina]